MYKIIKNEDALCIMLFVGHGIDYQAFYSWDELNKFILDLKLDGIKVFGPEKEYLKTEK